MTKQTTIDAQEIEKFSKMADEWWDPEGKFKPLHLINPIRLQYIREVLGQHFSLENMTLPLSNLKILDIGCGGGLVSIPLARLGADITAIDASEKNIKIASMSADKFNVKVRFKHSAVEELDTDKFDVVLALEVIEHISNIEVFVQNIARLLKNDGILIISTINRTTQSYLQAIVAAEYLLQWMPIGTHEFKKFLKPSEIANQLTSNNLKILEMKGLKFNPFKWQWSLSDDLNVNYFIVAKKSN
jgi:2-polyprenyl-6-hydroxyphenyl methylase/3-demethylubiquinone-9 3-methyltransferase